MKVTLNRIDTDYHFQLTNERGHIIDLDNSSDHGGNNKGASPMELLLMGLAGCSGIDIIAILKKQKQVVTSFKAEVEGFREQVADAKPFKKIAVVFYLEGDVNPQKALRAAQLSFEKYCSVSKTLELMAKIEYRVFVNKSEVI
ncbi:MAG: OsmC family protein [Flavobacterium sp.]|jgi:putative redox protein|nr:OsmC family protein [Flavobacterium sp.]MBP6099956.1 OsmC family protein [Flavobacterium sp.]